MERLQKVLAQAGLGSRRQCEKLITEGRVTVDRVVVRQLGAQADPAVQQVAVDGEPVRIEKKVYYLVNKPRGVICTNRDPQGRPRVIDLLVGVAPRLYTVGRLDAESEGLILLTNDGELTQRLTHPRYGVPKTYAVVVRGRLEPPAREKLRRGTWIAEGKTRLERLTIRRHGPRSSEIRVTLREGRNREIRRVLARVGHPVSRLRRVAIGPLTDSKLKPGQWRKLTPGEVTRLRQACDTKGGNE